MNLDLLGVEGIGFYPIFLEATAATPAGGFQSVDSIESGVCLRVCRYESVCSKHAIDLHLYGGVVLRVIFGSDIQLSGAWHRLLEAICSGSHRVTMCGVLAYEVIR